MADWEEIKRLAADFQRAQLSSTVQKLSERNCIEIVQKLLEQRLIEVIYTTDGKEYLTPQEVTKEIREELIVHGGRINLVDLAAVINIDLSHVEKKANELVQSDQSLSLVLGQLIDQNYLDSLAEEVNDQLQEQGQVTLAELTKHYDLPADFLFEAIEARLGSVIQGKVDDYDRGVIFTEAYVARRKAKIRGAFSAITQPTSIINLMNQFGVQERLFYSMVEDLVQSGRLSGSVSGGRQDKAVYVPDIYTKQQNDWANNFYKQNGYLEYAALSRLGISDPKGYIRKQFKSEQLLHLSTCSVGQLIRDRVEAEVEEGLSTIGWIDVSSSLPSIFSGNDTQQVLQQSLKSRSDVQIFCDTIVTSQKFLNECSKPFDRLMAQKAEKDAKTNPALLSPEGDKKMAVKVTGLDDGSSTREDRRDQRRKKGPGGKGGGTQGREVKNKATKKKYRTGGGHGEDDSDDEAMGSASRGKATELEFLSVEEIEEELKNQDPLRDCLDEFVTEIAEQLYRPLRRQYQAVARSVYLQTIGSATSTARRKIHGELQEKINGLWTNAKLFEKGIRLFTSEETVGQLSKHLLKTVCTDITNLVLNAVASDNMMSVQEDTQFTPEIRLKLLSKMPDTKTKAILTKLHASLNGKSMDEFFSSLDQVCGPGHLEIMLKKPDKKKERQLLFAHRQALAEQLRMEEEPAMALHLAVVLMFQIFTQCQVHVPGRCVPQLITFLEQYFQSDREHYQILTHFQELVIKQLKAGQSPDSNVDSESMSQDLKELLPKVKDIALNARRSTSAKEEDDK